jgi:uncharacterized protein with GYD domain
VPSFMVVVARRNLKQGYARSDNEGKRIKSGGGKVSLSLLFQGPYAFFNITNGEAQFGGVAKLLSSARRGYYSGNLQAEPLF